MRAFTPVILIMLFLPGCATLSKNECLTADWQAIGLEDGSAGQSPDRVDSHRQACAEYGVAPDPDRYQQGYTEGLLIFCTPRNGFAKAKSGVAYSGICPAEAEDDFLRGYTAGRKIFSQTAKINELASELRNVYNRLEETGAAISRSEHELLADSLSQDDRRRLRRTISRLRDEQHYLQRRSYLLRDEKADADDDLNRLRRRYRSFE